MRFYQEVELSTGHRRSVPLGDRARDLVAQSRAQGFQSPSYLMLRDHLWQYAMPVMKDALRSGKMPRLLSDHNVLLRMSAEDRLALHTSSESRDELAVDVIAAGEVHLRTVIKKNRWRPDDGASIETFFVTGCLFGFPTVYRRWSKARADHHMQLVGVAPEAFGNLASSFDTATSAIDREMVRLVLREADPMTRVILSFLATGHTYAEVGGIIGLSAKAVEGRVYRFRRLMRRRLGDTPSRSQAWPGRAA